MLYDFPNHSVAKHWCELEGTKLFYSTCTECWWDMERNVTVDTPKKGRWLPWTLPKFPIKCNEIRLCIIKYRCGNNSLVTQEAAWYAREAKLGHTSYYTQQLVWVHQSEVESVQWLTEEYTPINNE